MAIRAATPMNTPSMVSAERMRLRASAWVAAAKIMLTNAQAIPPPPGTIGAARAGAAAGAAGLPDGTVLGVSVRISPSRITMMRSA